MTRIREFKCAVGSESKTFSFNLDELSIGLGDVFEIAGAIGDVSVALAAKMGELAISESEYRQWRAIISNAALEENPKLAEWKVKAQIELDANFLHYKAKLAELVSEVEELKGLQSALRYKGKLVDAIPKWFGEGDFDEDHPASPMQVRAIAGKDKAREERFRAAMKKEE